MPDLKQNDSGDLVIENNAMVLVEGAAEVRQRIMQRLRTFRGEWFLDYSVGVPYLQDILQKDTRPETVTAILHEAILGTLGVIELKEFKLEFNSDRTLTCIFKVLVFSGEIITLVTGVGI